MDENISDKTQQDLSQKGTGLEAEGSERTAITGGSGRDQEATHTSSEAPEVNFANYVTGMTLQTLIFLGEMPNPMTNKTEMNLPQAKFLIDTLIMIRDKTEGNLTEQEKNTLQGCIYELEMKYVQLKGGQQTSSQKSGDPS